MIEDEYVVIVLEIQDKALEEFYGGKYLIQHWSKKKKSFQSAHNLKPQSFFLNRQRFAYTIRGVGEEAEYIYISSFYQEVFQKIRHPLYHPTNRLGIHDKSLYVDPKNVIVGNENQLYHAKLRVEKNEEKKRLHRSSSRGSTSFNELGADGVLVTKQEDFCVLLEQEFTDALS
jgi:hypothetical protein